MNLIKNISPDGSSSRTNVRTITTIADLTNTLIKSIEINSLSIDNLSKIKKLISSPGDTNVIINISNENISHQYKLNEKEKLIKKQYLNLKMLE